MDHDTEKTVSIEGFPPEGHPVFDGQEVIFKVVVKNREEGDQFEWGLDCHSDGNQGTKCLRDPEQVGDGETDRKYNTTTFTFRWNVELGHGGQDHHLWVWLKRTDERVCYCCTEPYNVQQATLPLQFRNLVGDSFAENVRLGSVPIALQSTPVPVVSADDEATWAWVLASTRSISFPRYCEYVQEHYCNGKKDANCDENERTDFLRTKAYSRLQDVTGGFMKERCEKLDQASWNHARAEVRARLNREPGGTSRVAPSAKPIAPAAKLVASDLPLPSSAMPEYVRCLDKGYKWPCPVELIWSYWHEEAMVVQTIKAISRRFQNRLAPGARDPLQGFEIDPLRPLSNLIWGYIQDELHRISVLRRAHEYEHEYGISLYGRALKTVRPADRRSKFLESFHNLLYRCVQFYKQDDDKTVSADGFPVLNAIKETHYLIAAGANNQFGDLPETDREERLIEMWILARPEMREFLRGRPMVPYPEDWMDRVDHMKTLQNWTDVSVVHFHDLAEFGEHLLLSIRWGSWSRQIDSAVAVAWARVFRPQVQGYIHAYRAATGVDLTAEITDQRQVQERYLPPGVLLQRRLMAQVSR